MSSDTNSLVTTTPKILLFVENATAMNESWLNHSLDDTNSSVKAQLTLYDVLIPSIGGLIMLLNFLVVVSSGLILKKGQQPRACYLFLGNVALTDLLTGIAVVFGQLYPIKNRDHHICALQLGMIVASTLTSVYSVGLIAIDRFLYIIHGIQYQQWIYPLRARLLIALTWLIGGVVGFMPLFGWYGDTNNGKICWFILMAPKSLILLTVIVGVIPLLLVVVLYSIILYHAIRKIIQLQAEPTPNPQNLRFFRGRTLEPPQTTEQTKKHAFLRIFAKKPSSSIKSPSKWKAIKVVLFTTGSFVVTWSPYFISCIVYVYQCQNIDTKKCKNLRLVIASPLAILGFTNSLINPIIYAWWHKGFRTFVQNRVSTVIMRTGWRNNTVTNSTSQDNKNRNVEAGNGQSTSAADSS